jgi:hypothetical protein
MAISSLEILKGFDEDMVLTVRHIVTLARAAHVLWDCPGVEVVAECKSRVMKGSYHLINKLLVPRKDYELLQIDSLDRTVQECSCISLLLWLCYSLGGTSGTPPGNWSIRVWSVLLEHMELVNQVNVHSTRRGPYSGLFFWMLGLGTLITEEGNEKDMWFRRHSSAEAKYGSICTYALIHRQ